MRLKRLIRDGRRRLPPDRLAEGAFWLVLLLAVVIGGSGALAGLPALMDLLFPSGLIAAEADSGEALSRAEVPVSLPDARRHYGPTVLTPLPSRGFPDWLIARMRFAREEANAIEPSPELHGPPLISIVIDDLGADVAGTRRALALPADISLSFLPYADATPDLAREAERRGHQVLVHLPMEPDGKADPGPMALMANLGAEENIRRLNWALARVPGYAGVNNHMGSEFTASRVALIPVMEVLAGKHVFFLDSRTTAQSQAVTVARAFGVMSAARDVFLDDVDTAAAVEAQLAETEARAKTQGIVIAIGHPHAVTLDALGAWIGKARGRGFEFVPAGIAIRKKIERGALLDLLQEAG